MNHVLRVSHWVANRSVAYRLLAYVIGCTGGLVITLCRYFANTAREAYDDVLEIFASHWHLLKHCFKVELGDWKDGRK